MQNNILEQMEKYSYDIIDKKIIACKKHIWACQRFLNDIDKFNKKKSEWIFDEKSALKFLKFMTLFRHRIGVLQGQYIDPHIIQIFIFGNIYGWYHKETGRRRFRKLYWQTSRKQAKTQSLAIVGLYEISAFGEPYAECYIAATKKSQAKLVYNEANYIYKANKILKNKFKTAYTQINHILSNSFMRPLSKDDSQSGDGFSPQCGILDELHAHKTFEYYGILDSGMVARKSPLLAMITTAGLDLDYPCYKQEYQYISQLLDPNIPIENDAYFAIVNEYEKDDDGNLIDDIEDESKYLKANPILASYPEGVQAIKERVKIAKVIEEKKKELLTKTFNVWVNIGENKFLNMDKWAKCKGEFKDEKRRVTFGIDLSRTIDLTSVSWAYEDAEDGIIDVDSHSFIPEETLKEKIHTDNLPYDLWIEKGWITKTEGAETDYNYIIRFIVNMVKKFDLEVIEICYDPHNATQFMIAMHELGFEMVEILQRYMPLSEPTKKFRAMCYNKKIRHRNNPVLTIALNNAVEKEDDRDNIMLSKKKSTGRIDPAAALMNSFVRVIARIEEKSVYDDREEGEKLFNW